MLDTDGNALDFLHILPQYLDYQLHNSSHRHQLTGVGVHGITSVIGMVGVLVTQRFNYSHFLFHGIAVLLFCSIVVLLGFIQNEVG